MILLMGVANHWQTDYFILLNVFGLDSKIILNEKSNLFMFLKKKIYTAMLFFFQSSLILVSISNLGPVCHIFITYNSTY